MYQKFKLSSDNYFCIESRLSVLLMVILRICTRKGIASICRSVLFRAFCLPIILEHGRMPEILGAVGESSFY